MGGEQTRRACAKPLSGARRAIVARGGDRTDLCRQKGQSVRGAPTLACRSAAGVGIAATGWQGAASLL